MTSGVRKGCPLSPLLYALAADALLEKICTTLPGIWARAYADDTAVVLSDFWGQAPALADIFDTFASISNLHVNYSKRVIIPLHPRGPAPLRAGETNLNAVALTGMANERQPRSETKQRRDYKTDKHKDDPLATLRGRIRETLPRWGNMML